MLFTYKTERTGRNSTLKIYLVHKLVRSYAKIHVPLASRTLKTTKATIPPSGNTPFIQRHFGVRCDEYSVQTGHSLESSTTYCGLHPV